MRKRDRVRVGRRSTCRLAWLAALAFLPVLAVCNAEEEAPAPVEVDAEYRGLSREQIEAEATPMTQAEAESLGIVDTTILIQPPMNPDSVLPPDSIANPQ